MRIVNYFSLISVLFVSLHVSWVGAQSLQRPDPITRGEAGQELAEYYLAKALELKDTELDSSEVYATRSKVMYSRVCQDSGVAAAFVELAHISARRLDGHQSVQYADSAYYLYQKISDYGGVSASLIAQGDGNQLLGHSAKALGFYQRAEKLAVIDGDTTNTIRAVNAIAMVLRGIGDYHQAVRYNLRILTLSQGDAYRLDRIIAYLNLGDLHNKRSMRDSARHYLKTGLRELTLDPHKYAHLTSYFYANLAENYYDQREYGKTLHYARRAIRLGFEPYREDWEMFTRSILQNVYYEQGLYAQSLKSLEKYCEQAQELGKLGYIALCYEDWVEYHREVTRDYEAALVYADRLYVIEDSLNRHETEVQIETLRSQAEVAENDRRISLLEAGRAQQERVAYRNRINIFIGISLLLCLIVPWFLAYWSNSRAKLANADKTLAAANLEILRSRINPQFIFSILNSIQVSIPALNKFDAYTYLGKFAGLLRLNLTTAADNFLPLDMELQRLHAYLELETLRHDRAFDYQIDVSPSLHRRSACLPNLIFQPLVERSLEWGLLAASPRLLLRVNFDSLADELHCITTCENVAFRCTSHILENIGNKDFASARAHHGFQPFRQAEYDGARIAVTRVGADRLTITLRLPLITEPISHEQANRI